jgi:hypothetical protein
MPSLSFSPGAHVCHIYQGFKEQRDLVVQFFKEGLSDGEHCLYITATQSPDEWYSQLSDHGINVLDELNRGRLQIVQGTDWRQTGDMNSVLKAREAILLIQDLLAKFPGVRIAGDAAWSLNPPLPVDQLCHMEATMNLVYEGWNVRTICQYDLKVQSPEAIHAALRTHPLVVLDRQVVSNGFYEAPRILANEPHLNYSDADRTAVENILTRLRAS